MNNARQIEEAAAVWLLRREEADWTASDEAALATWLDESDAHKAALWRLEHGWRLADRIGALGPAEPVRDASAGRRRVIRIGIPAMAASLAALFAWPLLGPAMPDRPPAAHFDTPVGGRKVIALADGSRIELNTATSVRTATDRNAREVWLDRGEAYFEVRHLDGRSFVVHAGARTITVIGTKFSVLRDGGLVRVSVVEGRVRIDESDHDKAAASMTVTGGDVAIARGPATLVSARSVAKVEDMLAWRDGMLTFDQASLGDVAAEFNRYNAKKLVISDPAVAAIRIGGTFQANRVEAFAQLLKDAYGLGFTMRGDEIVISG